MPVLRTVEESLLNFIAAPLCQRLKYVLTISQLFSLSLWICSEYSTIVEILVPSVAAVLFMTLVVTLVCCLCWYKRSTSKEQTYSLHVSLLWCTALGH